MKNPYPVLTNDEQNYTCPPDMDIMKCLYGGLCPVPGSTGGGLDLYLNNYNVIKLHCSITVNTITKNSMTQLKPNHYLMTVIKLNPIKCRCPDFTDRKTINPPLAVISIPEANSIFTLHFLIPAINSFTS